MPVAGYALYTLFTLEAGGWVSSEPPLQYSFETERGILRTSSPNTVLENARFPIGFAPPSLRVSVVVSDALESTTTSSSRNVNVTISNISSSLDNEVNLALSTGFADYSLSEICQVVVSTAGILDDEDDEVLEIIVSALSNAVDDLFDPELEQIEQSIESSRALTESSNLDNQAAREVLNLLNELALTLSNVGGIGASGSTTVVETVIDALSNLLAEGSLLAIQESSLRDRRLEDGNNRVASDVLLETVDALTLVQRETLAENEDTIGARAANLRTASKIVSNQFRDGTQDIGITGMNASSSIVPDDDGSVYAISLTEFLVNPRDDGEEDNPALSRVVRFDLNVTKPQEREAYRSTTAKTDVNLTIPGEVALNATPAVTALAECECGFVGFKEVECPDATVSLYCDGLAPGVFNYTCNSTSLACATWDVTSRRWIVPPSCETLFVDEASTVCACRVEHQDIKDYSTRRAVTNSAEEYTQVFETEPDIRRSQLVLVACLVLVFVTFVAAVVGERLDQRSKEQMGSDDDITMHVRESHQDIFAAAAASRNSLESLGTPTARALVRRQTRQHISGRLFRNVVESLTQNHPMLDWYYVYSAAMPRKYRAFKLGAKVALIFLMLALEVVWVEFPSVDCGVYDDDESDAPGAQAGLAVSCPFFSPRR
ncbi:hypothetical protein CTAYLR_000682 [Chrysophaeum taylorii]|uniref:PKD/REJ-like domain-containing protein n=1 Tax=Chrysophaeum taylorii TaxID=2483200 RepID=A0AAD7U918_9STRA|nr:hypothetical protein CTAYLR_000682 [Chrysophaeum taylorii]